MRNDKLNNDAIHHLDKLDSFPTHILSFLAQCLEHLVWSRSSCFESLSRSPQCISSAGTCVQLKQYTSRTRSQLQISNDKYIDTIRHLDKLDFYPALALSY